MPKNKRNYDEFENHDPQGYAYTADGFIKKLSDAYRRLAQAQAENANYSTICKANFEIETIEKKMDQYEQTLAPASREAFHKKREAVAGHSVDKKEKAKPVAFHSMFAHQVTHRLSLKSNTVKYN